MLSYPVKNEIEMLNKSTVDWLNQNLVSYTSPSYCLTQISAVLTTFPSIQPKTDFYLSNNNPTGYNTPTNTTKILLIFLTGTIPVIFRNASYYFPIEIILPLDYPASRPMVRIIALEGMRLREGRLIREGKLVHPILERWERRELVQVLQVLQRDFGVDPPLEAVKQPLQPPSYSPARPLLPPRSGSYTTQNVSNNLPYTLNNNPAYPNNNPSNQAYANSNVNSAYPGNTVNPNSGFSNNMNSGYINAGNLGYPISNITNNPANSNNNANPNLRPPTSFSYIPQPQQSQYQRYSNPDISPPQPSLAAPKPVSQETIDRQNLKAIFSSSLQGLLNEFERETQQARSRGELLRRNGDALIGMEE